MSEGECTAKIQVCPIKEEEHTANISLTFPGLENVSIPMVLVVLGSALRVDDQSPSVSIRWSVERANMTTISISVW